MNTCKAEQRNLLSLIKQNLNFFVLVIDKSIMPEIADE